MNSLAGPLAGRDTPSSSGSTGFETPDGTLNLEVGSQPPALVGELYQVAGWTNLDTRELSSGATQVLLLEDAYSSSSSNSGRIALATFSGSHGSLEWISDPIAVGKDELRVVSGESTVFAIGDGVLSALDRDTGELNWHETIGSPWWEAATADDVLAVQLSSGEVRAWRGTDGVEPWSRPVATNTRMLSVDGYLLLASSPLPDAQGATSQAIDVATVDPLSGGTVATVALKCPAAQAVTSWDFMTVLLRVPGSEDVVAVGGESAPCLTRWNPMTGRTVWTVTAKGRLPNGLTGDAILSRSHAVLASRFESAVASIDLATGEVHNFEQPDGWAIILHAFARGIVVARVRPSTSGPGQLIGFDAATGRQVWEVPLPLPGSNDPGYDADVVYDYPLVAWSGGELATIYLATLDQRWSLSVGSGVVKLMAEPVGLGPEYQAVYPTRVDGGILAQGGEGWFLLPGDPDEPVIRYDS